MPGRNNAWIDKVQRRQATQAAAASEQPLLQGAAAEPATEVREPGPPTDAESGGGKDAPVAVGVEVGGERPPPPDGARPPPGAAPPAPMRRS